MVKTFVTIVCMLFQNGAHVLHVCWVHPYVMSLYFYLQFHFPQSVSQHIVAVVCDVLNV